MDSLGQSIIPISSKVSRSCLRSTQKVMQGVIKRVRDFCEIPGDIAVNVVTYAKTVERDGKGFIDINMFNAQCVRHFDISHHVMLQRMYHACKRIGEKNVDRCKIHRDITSEEYAKMIGLFIGEADEKKTEFVFTVYDVHCSGILDKITCKTMIKEGVCSSFIDDLTEMDQITTDIFEMVMNVYDINGDGSIDLYEFKTISATNPLYTQCLGRCLPNSTQIFAFKDKLVGKSTLEVAAYFRNERKLSLNGRKTNENSPMYPIELEMPIGVEF